MEPIETDGSEVLETTETEEETVENPVDEEKEQLKRDKEELEKKNKQLFERLKKEGKKENDGLSTKDIIFLSKAPIHEDDIAEVTELARLKEISVSEAYNYLKPVLDVREEQRKTAQATQTKGGRGTVSAKPEEILRRASEGKLPEDEAGIEALVAAREAQRIGGK